KSAVLDKKRSRSPSTSQVSSKSREGSTEGDNPIATKKPSKITVPSGWLLPDPSPPLSSDLPSAEEDGDEDSQGSCTPIYWDLIDEMSDRKPMSTHGSSYSDSEEEEETDEEDDDDEDRTVYPAPLTAAEALGRLKEYISEKNKTVWERTNVFLQIVFESDADIRDENYTFKGLLEDLMDKSKKSRLAYLKKRIDEYPNIIRRYKYLT
ncbi:MAG: hypothetical protein K2Q34_00310, partial [Alphaproteobacteria bacterium]|nr:hypothetical protein [Alphaproteobacteria bacterium]